MLCPPAWDLDQMFPETLKSKTSRLALEWVQVLMFFLGHC